MHHCIYGVTMKDFLYSLLIFLLELPKVNFCWLCTSIISWKRPKSLKLTKCIILNRLFTNFFSNNKLKPATSYAWAGLWGSQKYFWFFSVMHTHSDKAVFVKPLTAPYRSKMKLLKIFSYWNSIMQIDHPDSESGIFISKFLQEKKFC